MCLSAISLAKAQTDSIDFQSDPQLVMEEIFKAANTENYSNLSKLCPPDGLNDGDTQQYICNIASASNNDKKEFISYFKDGRLTSTVIYNETGDKAEVPFWFNHPGGENRSNETMNMIKIDGKWFLISF